MNPIVVEVIRSEPEFDALREQWNALADAAQRRSMFLRHEWFAAAWHWRRTNAKLHLLVARRADTAIGILPLVITGKDSLEALTVPDTQAVDMLCSHDEENDVAAAFARMLYEERAWRRVDFDSLSSDSVCIRALEPALRRSDMAVTVRQAGHNYCIDLSGTWKAYWDTRSRSLKKALNLAGNRLGRQGEVEVLRVGPGETPERFQWALEQAIAISAQSWKTETGNSLDQPGPQAFIRALTALGSQRGWVEIWLLTIDGVAAAMEYDVMSDGNVHALRADFVAENVQTSPGAHLFRVQLERLFGRGLVRYYLGRGDNPYKRRWTDSGEPLLRLSVYNRTARGRAAWLRDQLRPLLHRTRNLFRRRTLGPTASGAVRAADAGSSTD